MRLSAAPFSPRITPARAGKTMEEGLEKLREKDHPRACGENMAMLYEQMKEQGSPPRVRGKLFLLWTRSKHIRITPARAGKTRSTTLCSAVTWDHPRACGENMIKSEVVRVTWGSPPRVRGKLFLCACRLHKNRITPARAGKTFSFLHQISQARDHPRACGEN